MSVAHVDDVLAVLQATRFTWASEDDLQRGLAAALDAAGLPVEREVRLSGADRIDLRVGRVGIEVKVAGSWRDVERQMCRYAASDSLDAVVLVTSKPGHTRARVEVGGKPIVVHRVGSTL